MNEAVSSKSKESRLRRKLKLKKIATLLLSGAPEMKNSNSSKSKKKRRSVLDLKNSKNSSNRKSISRIETLCKSSRMNRQMLLRLKPFWTNKRRTFTRTLKRPSPAGKEKAKMSNH